MLGTFVNTIAVLIGGSIGLILKKGLPERVADTVMKGIGLCVIYIGIDGCLEGSNALITIISAAVGAVIGELLDLDGKVNRLGGWLERKVSKNAEEGKNTIAKGFVSASLLFCVGAMTIVGSLNSGLSGDHQMLYTKSLLDFIAAIIFASSLGVGVLFSAVFVLVYQGAITLLAGLVAPFLTEVVIAEMTCIGSVLIMGIGLNMLGITKLKMMNYVPAIFLPILLCTFM
ncbi:MAG: DUF554 domain-containing protein [Clostridia bacterium]|nr:DUF554 domain-containing protein [Clostridia bacterium]